MTCEHTGFGDHPFQVPPETPVDHYYLIALLRKRPSLPQGLHLVKYLDIRAPAHKRAILKNITRAFQEINASTSKLVPGDVFYLNANVKGATYETGYGVIVSEKGYLLVDPTMLACWFSRWYSDDVAESYPEAWYRFKLEHGLVPEEPPTMFDRLAPSLN